MLSTWKTAPALAAGCTVVLKPAEWSPLSCSLLADLAREAGLPPGVFNVVQGIGEEVGAALVAHPLRPPDLVHRLDRDRPRRSVAAAAQNLVPFTAELGGKNPFIVFADADLDAAAAQGSRSVRRRRPGVPAGHPPADRGAASPSRSSSAFTLRRRARARRPARRRDHHLAADPPRPPRARRGLRRACARRGRRDRPRRLPRLGGLLYEPTLFEPRSNDSEIVQREVFGPVLTFQTFRTRTRRSSSPTRPATASPRSSTRRSMGRAERIGRAVRGGMVWVNTFLVRDLTAPFGGIGHIGIGREGGDYALDFYSDLKTLQIRRERPPSNVPAMPRSWASSWAMPKGRTSRGRAPAASPRGCASRSRAPRRALTEELAVTAFDPATRPRGSGSRRR